MRWTVACAGCGQMVRAHDQYQALQCPVCSGAVSAHPPAVKVSLRQSVSALLRHRRWLAAGVALAACLSVGAFAARGLWRKPQPNLDLRPLRMAGMGKGMPLPEPVPPGIEGGPVGPVGGPLPDGVPRAPGRPIGPGAAGPVLGPAAGGPPTESPLQVSAELTYLLPGPVSGPGRTLPTAGRIAPCLAVAVDAETQRLLTCSREGELRWYDHATLRLLGSCKLDRPAVHLLVIGKHRTLITSSARPGSLFSGPLGDTEHVLGDIISYSLEELYKSPAGRIARPARTLEVNGHISSLLPGPTGERVYYLAEAGRGLQVGEVAPDRLTRLRTHSLRYGGAAALALAPDEPVLYALSGGRVTGLSLKDWKVTTTFPVGGTTFGVVAGTAGKLYLADRRNTLQVLVVDARQPKGLARWQTELEGRCYLLPCPTGKRLFLGTSAVVLGGALELSLNGPKVNQPLVRSWVGGDRERLLRGPVMLTPDGAYLITGTGVVFRADRRG